MKSKHLCKANFFAEISYLHTCRRVYYGVDVDDCYVDVDVVHVDVCVEDGDEDEGPGHFWTQAVLMLMF